jgi:molybdopterin converting factor small subunit
MKKLIYSMLALFCAAFAFTSCEDVPMPYDQPGEGGEDPVVVEPTGDGTAENPFNVAAALEYINNLGADVESDRDVYIKGKVVTVTEEYSTNFGNGTFYISDDGTNKNQFYVYRAMYLGNKKYANGNTQIQEGDDVIICGRVVNYKGTTPETAQNKSFLYSLNGETAGGGGGASGTPKGSGTLDDPYNPAGVIAYINTLGSDVESPKDVYIKGKIGTVTEEYSTNFGNGTFTIVEEGAEGTAFTVYRALYLGNKKFANGDTQIKEGDEVIVCGKVINYRGNTPETQQNKAYLYSLNGKTAGGGDTPTPGEAKGSGTLDDPFNPVAANNYASSLPADAKSDKDVYIKGKISSIKEKFGTQYGNASFYISEDGKAENEFYVFRTLYLGNVKYTEGENINVGDEVIICGKVMNYMGNTPETAGNESYIYSLNSGGGGGGETTGNVTKTVDGNIVTLVVADTAEGDKITVDLSAQGWESGKAVDPATITLSDGTKITFAKGEGSNTPAFYEATKGVRVYAKNTITISGKAVAKVVMTCDSYNGTAYTGNSTLYASASGTTFTICNEHSEAKGGEQLRVQAIEITYAQ